MADVFPLVGVLVFAAGIWLLHQRDERAWRRDVEDARRRSTAPAE